LRFVLEKKYYNFIFASRSSAYYHPTRERIFEMFYIFQNTGTLPKDFMQSFFHYMDGEQGVLSDNDFTSLKYILLNCCFYFCEFLIDQKVDAELVYISSDYFIKQVPCIRTEDQANKLLNDIAGACRELLLEGDKRVYSSTVEKITHYIQQQLYSPLKLNALAKYFGFSPQHLTTLFRKETGKSLYNYIADKKINEAKRMLIYTEKSVTEIANDLCYNSLAHLSSSFKGSTGVSPQVFRKSRQLRY